MFENIRVWANGSAARPILQDDLKTDRDCAFPFQERWEPSVYLWIGFGHGIWRVPSQAEPRYNFCSLVQRKKRKEMGQSLPRFESPKTTADFLALSFPWLSRLHCDILRFFRNVYSTVYFSIPVCLFFLAPPPFCFLPTAPRVGTCNDCHASFRWLAARSLRFFVYSAIDHTCHDLEGWQGKVIAFPLRSAKLSSVWSWRRRGRNCPTVRVIVWCRVVLLVKAC